MLRYSLDDAATADRIEAAVERTLEDGFRTGDIAEEGCKTVGTSEMGDAVAERI
jgi:3-isopropylmalate dehydrogenase